MAQPLHVVGGDGRQSPAMERCVDSAEAVGFSSVREGLRRIPRTAQPAASGRIDAGACFGAVRLRSFVIATCGAEAG